LNAHHIYSAHFFDIRAIRDTTSPYPYMLPSEATFGAFLKLNGVKPASSFVVLYDTKTGGQPFWATRAFWMF
jgi:3-mercaptopyruvate sulfurtransferase SseA